MPASETIKTPDSKRFETTRSILGYTHYLILKAQLSGNLILDGHPASVEEQNITQKIRNMCDVIERRLNVCRDDEIAELLESYDMAYRIGYQRMPDKRKTDLWKDRLIKAWASKKGHVEESSVFGVISGEVRFPNGETDQDRVELYNSILKKWIATLILHNSFPDASSDEIYQRLAHLMPLNLTPYLGKEAEAMKRKWYEANKVDDLSTINSRLLRSYRRFITSLPTAVLDFDKKQHLETDLLTHLSHRPDLDPHDAEAHRLALTLHQTLLQ